MHKIHYYYFCLYNLFYKDGFGLQDLTTYRALPIEQRPVLALCLGTWFWTLFLRLLFIGLFRPVDIILPIKHFELIIPLLAYAAYYFYFVNTDRYRDIYNQYKLTDRGMQKKNARKVIIFLVSPAALFILTCLISIYTSS